MALTLLEAVIKQGLSQKEAQAYIRAGKVLVNNEPIIIPSVHIKPTDQIIIKQLKQWVSRGAYKLLKAIDHFKIDFNNKVVIDIGSSTGGFTQVALEHGAKKVFAVDVGTNQLDYKLRTNHQVVVMEQTNLKNIGPQNIKDPIDVVVTDVSFISLKHVFAALKSFRATSMQVVALIKPQYEARREEVEKNGVVPERLHRAIIDKVINYAQENDFIYQDIVTSPIKGKVSKNTEYIALFERKANE